MTVDFHEVFSVPSSALSSDQVFPPITTALTIPYDNSMREYVGRLGHSSKYLRKRLKRPSLKTVIFMMTMYYWPFDRISVKQVATLTREIADFSHLADGDIPYSDIKHEDWNTYCCWTYCIQDRLMEKLGRNNYIAVNMNEMPFEC